jgi:hypothetical protein
MPPKKKPTTTPKAKAKKNVTSTSKPQVKKPNQYIQATGEETYGKEFWEEYHNNTKEKKNNL